MARFDIYKNHNGDGWLMDAQSDLLSGLNTRIAVPLLPKNHSPEPVQRLNPEFEVDGITVVLMTQFLAAIPASELKDHAGDLSRHSAEIISALDMLFTGF